MAVGFFIAHRSKHFDVIIEAILGQTVIVPNYEAM